MFSCKFYETKVFTTAGRSNERNILNRIRNCVAAGLNAHNGLPKLIVFVLDDDIITSIPETKGPNRRPLTRDYEHVLTTLMDMIDRLLTTYKDWLPQKCKRDTIPHLLWMAPPQHKYFSESNNEKRVKFSEALNTVAMLHANTSVLKLVKFWDSQDSNFFLEEQYRFTTEGLSKYWSSIDAAVKFWCIAIWKKFDKVKQPNNTPGKNESSPATKKHTKYVNKDYRSHKYNNEPRRNEDYYHQRRDHHYGHNNYNDYDFDNSYSRYKWRNKDYSKSSRRLPY